MRGQLSFVFASGGDMGLVTLLRANLRSAYVLYRHLRDRGHGWACTALYVRTQVFKALMERYGVGAQSYRKLPERARARLDAMGLRDGTTMKSYHDYYDTLQVLFGLAYADGLNVAQIETATDGVYHVGGTSIGTHHTKGLAHLYVHLRFLELAGDPLLHRRYASVAAPFTSALALRRLVPQTPQVVHQMQVVDELIDRLQRSLGTGRCA